jgi:two-component system cell cycle response regulator
VQSPEPSGTPSSDVRGAEGVAARPSRLVMVMPFGIPLRHLWLCVGAAVGLYSGVLLWDAHHSADAGMALLLGIAAGLSGELERSPLVQIVGYLLGLLSIGLAIPANGLAALAYGPWIALGGARFPSWPGFAGLGAAGVASYIAASVTARPAGLLTLLATAAGLALLHLGVVLAAREAEKRSQVALTDPLTGLANQRLLVWRLGEELSHIQRTHGTFALLHLDIQSFKQVNLRLGHQVGDRVLVQIAQILRDSTRGHDVVARIAGDEFAVLAPGLGDADAAAVIKRIRASVSRATTLPAPLRLAVGWVIAPRDGTEPAALLELAAANVFDQKLQARWAEPALPMELTAALWSLPDGAQQLVRLLHTEGIELEEHLSRVGQWSVALGQMVGLDPSQHQALAQAALVHDVGKLVLPRTLLRKPGPLTSAEQALLVQHVTSGVALLRALAVDDAVIEIVAAHHERWDGGGYPAGLAGNRIPLEARILAIADGCDAMTARRPYRKAWTTSEAIADLQLEGGRQFDPELVSLIIPVLSASE